MVSFKQHRIKKQLAQDAQSHDSLRIGGRFFLYRDEFSVIALDYRMYALLSIGFG